MEYLTHESIAIIGVGTMGHSIAIAVSRVGRDLMLIGMDQKDIQNAKLGIEKKLKTLINYDIISQSDKEEIEAKIKFSTSIGKGIEGATFIIEAIPEELGLKQQLFKQLGDMCPEDVILASTTSGLSPTKIAMETKNPERTVVAHFWNPAHLMPLVEVVRGEKTSDNTVNRTMSLMKILNKKPIEVKKDIPGFIVNRLQFALFREAQHILEEGAATKEDIDIAVMNSIARRLPVTGIFLSADMGGLDVYEAISSYLFADLSNTNDSCDTMKELVRRGKLGEKTGQGFYEWPHEESSRLNEKREELLIDFLKRDMNKP